jgi:hypothetical protein
MGRPTKFKREFVKLGRSLAEAGGTDREIAGELGIAPSTFYSFCLRYPEFSEAVKVGKAPTDDRVERSLYDRATGYAYTEQQAIKVKDGAQKERVEIVEVERFMPPDTTSMIFWLKNRRSGDWRDKQEIDHSGRVIVDHREAAREELDELFGPTPHLIEPTHG